MKNPNHDKDRRRLLQAMAASGLLAGLDGLLPAYALNNSAGTRHLDTTAARVPGGAPRDVTMDVHIRRESIDIAGGPGSAITINGTVPGPIVELWEGRNAHLRVHNHMDESTSIHWHGILLPFTMDGVPGVTFPGIDPGKTFEVDFPVRQYGTYWYHSHTGLQEQSGQYGPIVIHPAQPYVQRVDRDYVVVLSDWTFEDPKRVMAHLKKMSDYYNFSRRTAQDLVEDTRQAGLAATAQDRLAWAKMRMMPRDIADITGATYTYLMNGMHPGANWTALFKPGERIRLRVINASAMSYFNVRIPGLPMTVVAADGPSVEPVETDEFQIGVAETFDVIVEPKEDIAYTLMAESMDRSGYTRGTLAPRAGMQAAVPPLRAQPQRTMVDMGMDMQEMGGMQMSGPDGNKPMPKPGPGGAHGMQHGDKPVEYMTMQNKLKEHSPIAPSTDLSEKDHGALHLKGTGAMWEPAGPVIARHGPDTHGPGNTTIAKAQRYRLHERGTGLIGLNHRVLTIASCATSSPEPTPASLPKP